MRPIDTHEDAIVAVLAATDDGATLTEALRQVSESSGLGVDRLSHLVRVWCGLAGIPVPGRGPLYDAAAKDAPLGVGHIWTNVRCPAYRTYDPSDCTCQDGASVYLQEG